METLTPQEGDLSSIEGIVPHFLVVMGVSGTGKTTIATRIADRLGWNFQEGDVLHPPSNVAKMSAGKPLTDEDRAPWLDRCRQWLEAQVAEGRGAVLSCSALKRAYRDKLDHDLPVKFVYLETSRDVLNDRLVKRTDHFMPPSLLSSQLATLEVPEAEEPVIRVSGEAPPDEVIKELIVRLHNE